MCKVIFDNRGEQNTEYEMPLYFFLMRGWCFSLDVTSYIKLFSSFKSNITFVIDSTKN